MCRAELGSTDCEITKHLNLRANPDRPLLAGGMNASPEFVYQFSYRPIMIFARHHA
jgi:hypothetical protein